MKNFEQYLEDLGYNDDDVRVEIPNEYVLYIYDAGEVLYEGKDEIPSEFMERGKLRRGLVSQRVNNAEKRKKELQAERQKRWGNAINVFYADLREEFDYINDKQYEFLLGYVHDSDMNEKYYKMEEALSLIDDFNKAAKVK